MFLLIVYEFDKLDWVIIDLHLLDTKELGRYTIQTISFLIEIFAAIHCRIDRQFVKLKNLIQLGKCRESFSSSIATLSSVSYLVCIYIFHKMG